MRIFLITIVLFSFQQTFSQNLNNNFSKSFSELDSAFFIQAKYPVGAVKYFQEIIPNIIHTLDNEKDIDQKRSLLHLWFKAQQRFAWAINLQPYTVNCSDSTCLKHNILNYRETPSNYYKQFGLEIIDEPCYFDDGPGRLIYIPSISYFKNYAKLLDDKEFLTLLDLLEIDNNYFTNKKYFECLSSNQICDLILGYEAYFTSYPQSFFGSFAWKNYTDLTTIFISQDIFYEFYGDVNQLYSDAIKSYKKYIKSSKNDNFLNIVQSKLTELVNNSTKFYQETDFKKKQAILNKIFEHDQ